MRIQYLANRPLCEDDVGVTPIHPDLEFQPSLLGRTFVFQDEEGEAMITDENEFAIYVESEFFTGWMSKADFWDALGFDD